MKSKLYSVDFKNLYFVANDGEDIATKIHDLLTAVHCNDLVEDVTEVSKKLVNLVDIINEDEIED